MKIEDKGCGEYFISQVSYIRESPFSPKSYGKSQLLQAQHSKIRTKISTSINLICGGGLFEEHFYENTSIYIEKEKEEQEPTLISPSKYGPMFTIMQKQGYDGCSGLGSQKKGIIESMTTKG